jgi:hypothetical protein
VAMPAHRLAVALVVGAIASLSAAQPSPPSVQTFTANNGLPQTTTDQVTLRWTYTNPAAVGQPIAGVRIRYRPPGGTWPAWSDWTSGSQWNATTTMQLATTSGAPRLGPHEFEIQLRDSLGQMSATKTTSISRVTTSTTDVSRPRQRYQVDGRAAMMFAGETGFGFATVVIQPNSICTLRRYDNRIEARHVPTSYTVGEKPRCRFDFFVNKKLRAGWRMAGVRFTYDNDPQILVFQQRPSGTEVPFFSIEIKTPYIGGLQYIELEGPSGADWRDAFRY